MKKPYTIAVLLVLLLQVLGGYPGCGGRSQQGEEEKVVYYAIEDILIPRDSDSSFVVEWRRRSTGVGDVSPDELAQRYWKWEGGALTEINSEEYDQLVEARDGGDAKNWTYGQHAITVLEMDIDAGEALVEISSLYGPLTGSGVRYLLREEGGEWKTVAEETVWVSRASIHLKTIKVRYEILPGAGVLV
jgi:hypothetical protein